MWPKKIVETYSSSNAAAQYSEERAQLIIKLQYCTKVSKAIIQLKANNTIQLQKFNRSLEISKEFTNRKEVKQAELTDLE